MIDVAVHREPGARLAPHALDALALPTPFLVVDLGLVEAAYRRLRDLLPGFAIHYAVKCNPEPAILARLAAGGCRFEVASAGELEALVELGADPAATLYSNPVKPAAHVAAAFAAGVRRFAVDSPGELRKVAAHAPGAGVYVRIHVDGERSQVPLAGKFGIDPAEAVDLLVAATRLGLRAEGLTFHVGSQTLEPRAYARAIERAGAVMRALERRGVTLRLLDIGGGLPARYADPVPALERFAEAIQDAVARHVPDGVELVVEPGRALVAEAGVLATTVIGRARRGGREWLHLDAGAFNGLMEALETRRGLPYPLAASCGGPHGRFAVTGPTCDSEDTVLLDAAAPAGIAEGDRLYVYTAGAYTTAYASAFNGFALPRTVVLG